MLFLFAMERNLRLFFMVLIIFVSSLVLRLPFLSVPALNGDEGDNFDTVKQFLEKGISPWERMVFTPPPYYWAVSFVAYFFGLNEFTLRSVSLFFGTLTPVLLFFFAQYIFRDIRKSFVTALISSALPFFVLYSRDAHIEAMQVFIVILGIWVLEVFLADKRNRWWLLISVLLTWLSVSVKYNAVVPLAGYWLFKILTSRKEWKQNLKYVLIINFLAFVLLIFLTGFAPVRLAYFAYGILSWSINQSVDANVPWYYYVSVLFEGLSPLLFVMFAASFLFWLWFWSKGKLSKKESLVLFVCCFMLIIILLQGRKYPRHLMLIIPWIILIVSDVCVRLIGWLQGVKKLLSVVLLLFVILSAGWWSVSKIELYNQHVVWKDVGKYLVENAGKNDRIFMSGIDLWPVIVYSGYKRNISVRLQTELLKNGDFVVLYNMDYGKPFVIGSPLQNDLLLHSPKYGGQYVVNQTFYDYVQSKGGVVKEFNYDSVNKIKIVKITKLHRQIQNKNPVGSLVKHDRVILGICDLFTRSQFVQNTLQKFSERLHAEVQMKCAKGCVHTCGLF